STRRERRRGEERYTWRAHPIKNDRVGERDGRAPLPASTPLERSARLPAAIPTEVTMRRIGLAVVLALWTLSKRGMLGCRSLYPEDGMSNDAANRGRAASQGLSSFV